jgi:hypothetical protein
MALFFGGLGDRKFSNCIGLHQKNGKKTAF